MTHVTSMCVFFYAQFMRYCVTLSFCVGVTLKLFTDFELYNISYAVVRHFSED